MLITIKPHSTLSPFFTSESIKVDISSFTDIPRYLDSMQPRFFSYVREQKLLGVEEGYVLLDKNLRELCYDDLLIRAVRENDIIHIVPAIYGGGGKRGGLLAVFALFAVFAFFPIGAGLAGGVGGAAGAGAAGAKAAAGAAGAGGGLFSNIPSFLSNILVNVGLSLVSALFTKKQDNADSASRKNDMFGSLQNSTTSDTPVALHYGQVRVAGQLVSGYIQTINHGRNETVTVDGVMQGLEYSGIGGKGVGSFMLSSSSVFDTDGGFGRFLANEVDNEYSYNIPIVLYAFSDSTRSLAVYDIQNINDIKILSYSVDSTYLSGVRTPLLLSDYIGDSTNYIFTVSPDSNSVLATGIAGTTSTGVITDNNDLAGAYAIDLNSERSKGYVAARSTNTVTAIDIADPTIMQVISSYSDSSILNDVRDVKFDSLSNILYAISYASNTISAYSDNLGQLTYIGSLKNDAIMAGAVSLSLDVINKVAYVGAYESNKVSVIDISDSSNMSIRDDFTVNNVIGLAQFTYNTRAKVATISEDSSAIAVYDFTGSRYDARPVSFQLVGSTDLGGNCTSISNKESVFTVTSAEANTVSVVLFTEEIVTIDEDEGPDTVEVIRTLDTLLTITDDEYLNGVSSAVTLKA